MHFLELLYGWNWKQASVVLSRALALAPGDVETMSMAAQLAGTTGRCDEAIRLAGKAVELDPLNYFSNYALVRHLGLAGRYEEMEKQAERMISLNPVGLRSRLFLFLARLLQGQIEEAARAAEEVPAGWGRRTAVACARFAQGRIPESEAALAELKREDSEHAPFQIAEVHAFRGELDQAFEWLETGYQKRDSGNGPARCDPLLKNLHDDPRWLQFLRKMNLADDQLTWAQQPSGDL
jgi:tetratricopeptide (TPR) repeat protein